MKSPAEQEVLFQPLLGKASTVRAPLASIVRLAVFCVEQVLDFVYLYEKELLRLSIQP
ncbi:hypothetical protein [Endozoicomonas montiporae]|uniref:hypothetical protein n=1 Tax=Endozoicomonas montiporae TaxID=1027273 RepID=UPI000A5E3675|nr:hypothetical protein [Endozoicomonas montiporae]